MINKPSHFAIYAEDIRRASAFYSDVFQWQFKDYGSADFMQIEASSENESELIGAVQHRKYQLTPEKVIGFECSIAVLDIDDTANAITKAGGKILMAKTEIPQVGWIIKFEDTEGNIACAMQYSF